MRHSLFRSTCLGLLCATLASTNPISDFKLRPRSINVAKDGEEIAQNVKISEISKGLGDTKVNSFEEKEIRESEKTPFHSQDDQKKIDEVERTKTDSKESQPSKPINRSDSSSSSSSSDSESEETSKNQPKKSNSLLEQFKEIYRNWRTTIISNWKKNTSMEPLEKENTKSAPETKPGTFKHWYRTSDSILARLFRGLRRYFTWNKPQPVKGPLKPKVVETPKAPAPETKLAESSSQDLPASGSKEIEKPKDPQVGSEVDSKKPS